MNPTYLLSQQSTFSIKISSLLFVVMIGVIDYLAGAEIGLSVFYLLPIMLTTWSAGTGYGLIVSGMSAVTWLIADVSQGTAYSSAVIPYWNALVRLGFFLVIVFLQNALKSQQLQARLDPLTRLGNRGHFFKIANAELERALRYHRPLTVGYIDLDNFKAVNDTHGHKEGDAVLKAVAATFNKNIRSTDTVARLGGDEFALLLPETAAEPARIFFEKLNRQLLDAMKAGKWPVTFSIGIMTYIALPASVDEMVAKVDALMYAAKKSGKNSIKQESFTENKPEE